LQPAVRASPASEIATWLRQHWGIENSLHWVRDVTYDGDRSTIHIGNGAQIMASVRNTAINRYRLDGATESPRPAAPPR
jgi:predicted transposase YbfD/YdcC